MRNKPRAAGVFVALGLAVAAAAIGGSSAAPGASSAVAQPAAKAFTIRSSLDGKKVLPHRIRWIAYPSARVHFPGVEFLIDGKVVFANRLPPFSFGDDGRDEAAQAVKTGYLVTSWLAPGRHTFTVRAKRDPDRVIASKTVVARVPAAPAPPAALAGTWTRTLSEAVPPDRGVLYRVTAPAGPYRITIDRRYLRIDGPQSPPHGKADYVATATTLRLGGPVWTGDQNEVGLCEPWGPDATYSWSVSDRTLTLASAGAADGCKQRGAIFTGEWTRVN